MDEIVLYLVHGADVAHPLYHTRVFTALQSHRIKESEF